MGTAKQNGKMSIQKFMEKFPNDDICLEEIFKMRYKDMKNCPKCGREEPKFYRVKSKKCYKCGNCGGELYPLAGTIMHGSSTPIVSWLFAIYLFTNTKNGVSARELARHLGVKDRTAWRIGHKIRELMGDIDKFHLLGEVEVDESMIGGVAKGKRGWGAYRKTLLFGMVERGGNIRVVIVHNRKMETIIPIIQENVESGSVVFTDKFRVYKVLRWKGYEHHVKTDTWNCTNAIEGYWGNLKKGIKATHTWVSPKYLQSYINEFQFRYNRREKISPEKTMFDELFEKI